MWLDKPEEKEQDKAIQETPSIGAGGTAPVQSSSTGTVSTPSSLAPVIQTPTQKTATIQDYFKANKPQSETLGSRVAGKLGETKQQKEQEIGQAATSALGEVAAGTTKLDEPFLSQAVKDPTKIAGSESDYNKFLEQWNAAYKGPQSFESSGQYEKAAKAAQEAGQKAALAQSTGGRQQLLQEEFGVYGQGQKGLDEALLQQSSYFPQIGQTAKELGSLQDYLRSKSEEVSTKAKEAKETTEATKQKTQQAFEGSLSGLQSDLTARTAAAQKKAQEDAARHQAALSSGDPQKIKETLAELGTDPESSQTIQDYLAALNTNYGIKPQVAASYLGNPNLITPRMVASKGDYERAAALEKLTGQDYSGLLRPADIEKAGTGTLAKTGFKSKDLQDYLKSGLSIQDRSLLGAQDDAKLDWNAINAGNIGQEQTIKQVKDLVAAGKREGVPPENNHPLRALESNAMQGIQAIILGGENITTRPALKVYADTAVEAMVARGSDKSVAQDYINNWIQDLGKQIGRRSVPFIY